MLHHVGMWSVTSSESEKNVTNKIQITLKSNAGKEGDQKKFFKKYNTLLLECIGL